MGKLTTAVALILALAGCATTVHDSGIPAPNEYRVALAQAKDDPFNDCELLADKPGVKIGDLLQDFANAAAVGACYRAKHHALRDYFRPLVEKARTP